MSNLSVSENIKILEENIKKLLDQRNAIQTELVRLDGSLSVFKSMANIGIEKIEVPKDEVTDREVIDTLD
jgi:hypothetical protein